MKLAFSLAVIVVGVTSLGAAHAANLVQNPEFNDGLDGWSQVSEGEIVEADDTIGLPDAPSLHLRGDNANVDVRVQSSCIVIDDSEHVDFSMLVRPESGLSTGIIQPYSDAGCSTPLDILATENIASNSNWRTLSVSDAALPDGTQSVRIVLAAVLGSLGSVGDAHFDHIAFGPTGTIADAIDMSQEGLTGVWYNPATSGQGFEFVVSPSASAGEDGSLFGAWYTYDLAPGGGTDAQRWYSLQGAVPSGATIADVTIYRNTGGNFVAPPNTTAEPVGTGTLTFFTCTSGLLTYNIDGGPAGSVPVRSLMPNVECVEPGESPTTPPTSDFGLSGSWYDPATSGQGFVISVNPINAQIFFGWYTYAIDGEAEGAAGQRWFSAQAPYTVGTTSMDLTLYASTGGSFDAAGDVATTPVGTATLTFTSCTEATLDYDFTSGDMNGQSGTIALTRLGPTLVSCDVGD